jgi:DHA2 family multidrug resistance protein-like MFS transporter
MQGTARLTGQTLGAVLMAVIFGVVPLASAPEFALLLAAVFASLAALVSLGRVRHEFVGANTAIEKKSQPRR